MKKIFLLALLSMSIGSAAQAAEPTAQGLASLGWTCLTVNGLNACTPPGEPSLMDVNTMKKRPVSMLVMIFDAVKPAFIGSENLIRADHYAGQPCPRAINKLEPYKFEMLGAGYFSCHHFEKAVEL